MSTPLLTAEQVAEVIRLAAKLGHAYWQEARATGEHLRVARFDTLHADFDLARHLRSLTAPASVQPAVKEALTTPFDPEALIRAVLPGGHSCDPQAVADDIREWARGHAALVESATTVEERRDG